MLITAPRLLFQRCILALGLWLAATVAMAADVALYMVEQPGCI